MKVTVIDRAATDARWGSGPSKVVLREVKIGDVCPTCGGPRGEPRWQRQCEDGEWFSAHQWTNPCGHVDYYPAVLREAGVR